MHRLHPFDPRWSEPWWHGFVGWFVPFLVIVLMVGLAVWAILRLTGPGRLAMAPADWSPGRRTDSALELVRARYAQGEISRDEFVQLSSDLGGAIPREGQPGAETG